MAAEEQSLNAFIRIGQDIMRWDRRKAYGSDYSRVAAGPPALSVASPGFLGHKYRGIVILNQNPGLGKLRGEAHRRWDGLLVAWRDQGTRQAYDATFEFYTRDFPQVQMWQQWVAPVLQAARLSVEEIGYLNIGKSVLIRNQPPRSGDVIFQADWSWTRQQLELLNPVVLVAGGRTVGALLDELWPSPPFEVVVQNRARSQNGQVRSQAAREIGERIRHTLNSTSRV